MVYQSAKWPIHPLKVGHVPFFIQELADVFTRSVTKPEAHFTEVCLVLEYTLMEKNKIPLQKRATPNQ